MHNSTIERLEALAYHVAGFAVASYKLNLPFKSLALTSLEDILSINVETPPMIPDPSRTYLNRAFKKKTERHIIVCYASLIAEKRQTRQPESLLESKYLENISDFVWSLELPEDEQIELNRLQMIRAGDLLDANWKLVINLAAALTEKRLLLWEEAIRAMYGKDSRLLPEIKDHNCQLVQMSSTPYPAGTLVWDAQGIHMVGTTVSKMAKAGKKFATMFPEKLDSLAMFADDDGYFDETDAPPEERTAVLLPVHLDLLKPGEPISASSIRGFWKSLGINYLPSSDEIRELAYTALSELNTDD